MRVRWFIAVQAVLGLLAGLLLSQCYVPTYSDCAFRCGPAALKCPDQYECRADGYCHLPASVVVCAVVRDLGITTDLAADAASPVDAATD